jgi:hypothetical protein
MDRLDEKRLKEIKQHLEKLTGTSIRSKRIRSINVNPSSHHLPKMTIEVGQVCKTLEPDAPPEKVLAIFESTLFMVVTETRGFGGGLPYFFFRGDVKDVREYQTGDE